MGQTHGLIKKHTTRSTDACAAIQILQYFSGLVHRIQTCLQYHLQRVWKALGNIYSIIISLFNQGLIDPQGP